MTLYGYARVSVREPEDKNLDLTVHPHPRGESHIELLAEAIRWVHPHPRGESELTVQYLPLWLGSPPPAWGKRVDAQDVNKTNRFTPTRVGKAALPPGRGLRPPVHPHPRGESTLDCPSTSSYHGSPPPAWGKRPAQVGQVRQLGFTPTRVGKAGRLFALISD